LLHVNRSLRVTFLAENGGVLATDEIAARSMSSGVDRVKGCWLVLRRLLAIHFLHLGVVILFLFRSDFCSSLDITIQSELPKCQ
jgi:hypothetical protein